MDQIPPEILLHIFEFLGKLALGSNGFGLLHACTTCHPEGGENFFEFLVGFRVSIHSAL